MMGVSIHCMSTLVKLNSTYSKLNVPFFAHKKGNDILSYIFTLTGGEWLVPIASVHAPQDARASHLVATVT